MVPVLRRMVAEPPQPNGGDSTLRGAALHHLFELDPASGREAIRKEMEDQNRWVQLSEVKLLPKEDLTIAAEAAAERILSSRGRRLDYELVDQYASASSLVGLQRVFEKRVGQMDCAPQSAMLRYFLRVLPEYAAVQAKAALQAREVTRCYQTQLEALGVRLAKVQQIVLEALDDPDPKVQQNAAQALGRWGSAEVEGALWQRLEQSGTPPSGKMAPDSVIDAIVSGRNWLCGPDQLRRLKGLATTKMMIEYIEQLERQWENGAYIFLISSSDGEPTFHVLQYRDLTEDQLRTKLTRFPRGSQVKWQFVPGGDLAAQDAIYERVRSATGVAIEKSNHP
jgi:hypothetical protein